jgi:hypothetical protein
MFMRRFRNTMLFFALAYLVVCALCLAYEYVTYQPSP